MFADATVIQISGEALIGGLTTFGSLVAGGIVAAAKIITWKMDQMHTDNRQDRDAMWKVVNQQWELLSRQAQNTRVIADATQKIKRKVMPEDEEECNGG